MKNIKNENATISLTIIVPFYNSEKTIKNTLESIVNQSNCDWKIVLINDGSNDSSIEIAQEFELIFRGRISIIDIENGGQSIARDIGLAYVETDWVMYLDSDDLLVESALANISRTLAQSKADVIVTDYLVESNNQSTYVNNNKFIDTSLTKADVIEALNRRIHFSIWTSNLIYRTVYLRKNNFKFSIQDQFSKSKINIKHMGGEEIMFALVAIYFSDQIEYINLPIAKYVLRSSSMSHSFDYSRLGAFYNVIYIPELFNKVSTDRNHNRIIRNHYYKGALNGLIYNLYMLKEAHKRVFFTSISYRNLIMKSKEFYPQLMKDYKKIAFINLFTINFFKLSSMVNILFTIFPTFVLILFGSIQYIKNQLYLQK
jgi:glycosyltransferase involved in cell wall biosynthesis